MKTTKKNFDCEFIVDGMHCAACELLIEDNLSKVDGVKAVDAKLSEGKVYLQTTKNLTAEELTKFVKDDGYIILEQKILTKKGRKDFFKGFLIAFLLFCAFLLIQKSGIINLASGDSEITYSFVFLIGFIASISTCMAVVGGLVLSISSNYSKENKTLPLIGFHVSRIVSFFILGGIIGLIGSAATLTPTISFLLNILLFVVMLIMALNLLEVSSSSKRFQLRMPKVLGKKVIKLSEGTSVITPILIGAATFFLPCGFTQSMQLYSLTTGNAFSGAFTMLVFALGTFPVLALISFASVKLSKTMQSGLFYKTTGFLIVFFALFNLLSSLISIGLIPPILNL